MNPIIESVLRQAISIIPFSLRKLDKEFVTFYDLLERLEGSTIEDVKRYQIESMKRLLKIAYEKSSFYRNKFDENGFNPELFNDLSDLNKIPLLTKDEIRNNCEKMLTGNVDAKIIKAYTSGTTGTPLQLFRDKRALSREWAAICYQWKRIGYNPTDGRVEFRGYVEKGRPFIYLPDQKVLRINILEMNSSNIECILNQIKKRKYKYFHGYPSAILKFCKLINNNADFFKPKGLMLASEPVYSWQLDIIKQLFTGVEIIAHYGQAEQVALGAWFPNDERYFFIPGYGLVEKDDSNGELIATGFTNEFMPVIRYRLTDSVENFNAEMDVKKGCCLYPVVEKIIGRQEDVTFKDNGEMVPPAVVTFPFKKLKYIKACKIVQKNIGKIELVIESAKGLPDVDLEINGLIDDMKLVYGENTVFNYKIVDKIPLDKSGKFRWIECLINKK
jgi:phenylacetate-CoA ligase